MKQQNATLPTVLRIAAVFLTFMLLAACQRAVFACVYAATIGSGISGILAAMGAGLAMDASVAGYLTAIPALLAVLTLWIGTRRATSLILKIYFMAVSLLLAMIFTADLVLYGYWGFRLDTTPIFYITTSPGAAMASATWWQLALAVVAVGVLTWGIYNLLALSARLTPVGDAAKGRVGATIAGVLMLGALFVAIRGGFTVSTMNPSRAYFSSNARLNHLAMNPVFSLMYSAGHRDDYADSFRYFDPAEAKRLFALMNAPADNAATDIPVVNLNGERPDIYLIILESFSSHLMSSLGGEPIAVKLDSIAREGVLWTQFKACSFRTDRAIPAILNALPSQPTTSLMKYTDKMEHLPSIASELKRQGGYSTTYYYGGDANFTNMLATLVSGGFERIVSDKDFKLSERLSKWGAHDDVLFRRVLADATETRSAPPRFNVIQTSSSHEPFEVPYSNPRFAGNPRANSLAYTDSCVADFVNRLQQKAPRGRNALIVIVPDHYGTWPVPGTLTEPEERHAVPLILTGGAIGWGHGARPATPGCQTDIAATLLGLLGMDSSMFTFSRNLLDRTIRHYAWFSEPELVGLTDDRGNTAVYNIAADRPEKTAGEGADSLMILTKAYLQTLYSTIADLK